MSTKNEYPTIQEEIASVGDKKVKIVGSIATVICDLLNDVFFNKDIAQEKRTITTFEDYHEKDSDNFVIHEMINHIQNHDGEDIVITTPESDITDEVSDKISSLSDKYQKGFHLITYPTTMDHPTLEEIREMNNRLVSLENRIMDNGGHVYRTWFMEN